MKDYSKILEGIRQNLENYIRECNLKSLVLGISGGVDSALVAAIAKPVCDKLNIPLIGAWIEINGNKREEHDRAIKVGKEFCTVFLDTNLHPEYNGLVFDMDEPCYLFTIKEKQILTTNIGLETEREKKVRLGNIKARMRMIYLYNLAQRYRGCTLNTDNQTEYQLGFWTIHGDDCDLDLIKNLWKTEVYELTEYVITTMATSEQMEALQDCIDATPTDGLGISNSDLEQLGCDNYAEVDSILRPIVEIADGKLTKTLDEDLYEKFGPEKVNKILNRHLKTTFKRNLPIDLTYPKY